MSLRRGVWTVLTAVLLLFVTATVLVAIEVVALRSATGKVRNKYDPALLSSQNLLAGYINQESGERGYLITGQSSFLAPYTQGEAILTSAVDRLTTLSAGEPSLITRLHDATAAGDAWQRSVQPELAARKAGDVAQATQLVDTGASKAAFDNLRSKLTALQSDIQSRRTRAENSESKDAETLVVALTIAAAMTLAAVVVLVVASRHWVLHPIAGLGAALSRVQTGSLDSPVTVEGPSEFRALAADADAMRLRLVDQIEAASRATEGLAQRAPVVLDIRAALRESATPEPGLDVFGMVATAEGEIAGDWWDLVTIAPGRQVLVIADVSGHGAPAGLLATQLKSVIVSALSLGATPAEVFRLAATQVFGRHPDKFATAVLIDLDLVAGTLSWTNGGHPAPLLITTSGVVRKLGPTGPLVHPIADTWTTETAGFAVGDLLLVFSDGLTEARDELSNEFGAARVRQAVAPDATAEQAVTAVLAALAAHSESRRQIDDVTLVAVRRIPA
jgi:CHASE3 domain sensor protein